MEIEKHPTYCSLPFSHLQLRPNGLVYPCNRFVFPDENCPPEDLNTSAGGIDHILRNSSRLKQLRENLLSERRDSGCAKCHEEEDSNKGVSIRTLYNKNSHILDNFDPTKVELRWIEFAVSNICNLKCRMCTPLLSHRLKKEWEELLGRSSPHWGLYTASDIDIEKFLGPHLRHVKFTGGEPLLIPLYKEVLRVLTSKYDASKIFLNYSTNLMSLPDSETIELWKQFKYVEFSLSFDGTDEFVEYQRYPSKWNTIKSNTEFFLKLHKEFDARCGNRATYTVYNILNYNKMADWWINAVNEFSNKKFSEYSWYNPTHAHIPPHLSLTILPTHLKERVAEQLNIHKFTWEKVSRNRAHLIQYMNSEQNQDRIPEFQRFTRVLDNNREQSFERLCPSLSDLMLEEPCISD